MPLESGGAWRRQSSQAKVRRQQGWSHGGANKRKNFPPWSRCQKMAEFQKNCRGACGKKKMARSTSLKLREWLVAGSRRPPATVLPHALRIRRRLAAPKFAGLLKCVEKKGPPISQFSPPDPKNRVSENQRFEDLYFPLLRE